MINIGEKDLKLKKEITSSWTCPECGEKDNTQYFINIIPSGRTSNHFPKYINQIKESCSACGRYRRFVPQTEMIIRRFNQRLEKLPLKSRGFRDGV
jgi:predicted RNA-binding Zn-ribbon protein involved in translation (DUF1610 family)